MIELNNNSIFIGQIKQILHTFNLPNCQIGDSHPAKNQHFIKNGYIYMWDDKMKIQRITSYIFGKPYLNLTSTFPIKNLIYDRETHRYLGNYLRFLRDIGKINLMSMYNCFDSELATSSLIFKLNANNSEGTKIDFRASNADYFIYKIYSKAEELTVSCHTYANIEMCIYTEPSTTEEVEKVESVARHSYIKRAINTSILYCPFKNMTEADKKFIDANFSRTCILIKVPKTLKSSITVLEGDFTHTESHYKLYRTISSSYVFLTSAEDSLLHTTEAVDSKFLIASEKNIELGKILDVGFNVNPQLLSSENSTKNYLLGDRLVEYLCGNVICPESSDAEILKMQEALHNVHSVPHFQLNHPKDNRYYSGVWNREDSLNIKNYISKKNLTDNYDTLGYIDKDVEKELQREVELV